MSNDLSEIVVQAMLPHLDNAQMGQLINVLNQVLPRFVVSPRDELEPAPLGPSNDELIQLFLDAKHLEGCSSATLRYYRTTITNMVGRIEKHISHVRTEDVRTYLSRYLSRYERESCCSKVTVDNVRRIISSFFSWLEAEDYILKSPVRRIHKIKSLRPVREIYSDEVLEKMRDGARTARDLAMVDLLASTGMRVGELVKLDCSDVDFEHRECVVLGKGNKERVVYFDARTKIHLREYLSSRTDGSSALFVSLSAPHKRLKVNGVESRLRDLGRELGLGRVHPHKFRRTLATKAIDKGMPIEQVQRLLGHANIDTTLMYAMVDQGNVRASHRRYIA